MATNGNYSLSLLREICMEIMQYNELYNILLPVYFNVFIYSVYKNMFLNFNKALKLSSTLNIN